jgi:ABC-2 type transport system permease protein
MNLLRLELLRLRRTWRGPGVLAAFLLFGVLGPFTARYQEDIISRVGGGNGIQITVPPPQPIDGIIQYLSNAQQIGLIAGVVLAIGAFNFDAQSDIAIFLRTRVPVRRLLLLRFVVYATGVAVTFVLGAFVAWYETEVLLGHLPVLRLLVGLLYGALFYVYVIALAAVAAAMTRSAIGGVLLALGLVLTPSALAAIPAVNHWIPTSLANAMVDIVRGGSMASPLRASAVALGVILLSLWYSVWQLERREM